VAGPTTQVCVTYNNAKTNCLALPVAEAAPGVFTVDGTYAAAVNQDGSVNSAANPAPPNSIVSIYATGLGPINPPQADGSLVGLPLQTALPADDVLDAMRADKKKRSGRLRFVLPRAIGDVEYGVVCTERAVKAVLTQLHEPPEAQRLRARR